MKHQFMIIIPCFLKLSVVKVFPNATHHEKKTTIGGTQTFLMIFQGKAILPSPILYSFGLLTSVPAVSMYPVI